MSLYPLTPLRWYELWMLRFLSRSPRIERILVEQRAAEYDRHLDYTSYLETLYHAPAAER
jgi:hypothetical protein